MQLYSFFNSSTSYRVRLALALKGLEYEYHPINLRSGAQYEDAYLELNPAAGVPLLVLDDGTRLSQSLAIITYLDARYPQQRLLPEDALAQARVIELASLIACDMHPVNNLRILGRLEQQFKADPQARKDWYHHWIAQGFNAFEELLRRYQPAEANFCLGDQPTLADCCLIPQVANAQRMGCDLSAYPKLLAVYEFCQQLPAFQQAAPAQQPDFIA